MYQPGADVSVTGFASFLHLRVKHLILGQNSVENFCKMDNGHFVGLIF